VKFQAAQAALDMVRRMFLESPSAPKPDTIRPSG
jgi:hypothetical protein